MSELPYNRLQEDQAKQGYPPQQGQLQQQQGYPPQYGYPIAITNHQIGVIPTATVIARETQVQPEDHMGLSIFVLICCCLPVGIVAVIKASEVGSRFRSGDYDGAMESSREAKSWAMGGLIYGIVSWSVAAVIGIVYLILILVAVNEVQDYNFY